MMTWNEIKTNYPDQWVVLAEYVPGDGIELSGTVLAHDASRKALTPVMHDLFAQYKKLAVRYTGDVITTSDVPVLWRISNTPR